MAPPASRSTDTPDPLAPFLRDGGLVILDGGLATELERLGCDLHDPLWSARVLIESPDTIRRVHEAYFKAGADCAIAATYQATFEGFERRGLGRAEAAGLMRGAVELAMEARDAVWQGAGRPRPLVAASIGPYGAFLADGSEYRGDYGIGERELMEFHRPRMAVLAESGADLLACETIPCLEEARALARLLEEFPGCRAWLSFSARDGGHTSHGEQIERCAAELEGVEGVIAVGVNCTAPGYIVELVDRLSTATTKPIAVYPNSGEAYDAEAGCWMGAGEVEGFVDLAMDWYERGARLIGGCCRTTPEQIAALAARARRGAHTA